MRKPPPAALFSILLLSLLIETAHAQATSLTEGFDDTGNSEPTPTGIFAQASPWINVNNSDVPVTDGLVEPNLLAAWEHEFKYSDLPIAASFAGIRGASATFYGPSEGHDSAIVSS